MSRWLIVALCMPCLLLIGCKGKGARSDQDLLQGTWELLTVEAKGQLFYIAADAKDKTRWVFAGDKVNVISEFGDVQHAYTLNAKSLPKQIDLFGPLDNNKVGIYELKGDELKVCQVSLENGATRPAEFNSKDRGVLMAFRRVKP